MIDLLTKSKIRQRIILLFIYNQGKEFYLSEIAKEIHSSPGTTQRELEKLLRNDFLLFKKKANLSFYMLNKQYSLLEEVESIVKKTIGIEFILKNRLVQIENIEFAFLYGSFVKGGMKSDSDIDLFVIGRIKEDPIFKAVEEVEKIIGREINYHLSGKEEFLKRKSQNYFLKDILTHTTLLVGDTNEFRKLTE